MTSMFTMMMSISILMIFMNHPMAMGMLLIIQTILTAMSSGILMNTFWMSYILLISMLSGMLVLFIYMSSVASNEKFVNKLSMWMWMTAMTITSAMFLFMEEKMIIKNNYLSMGMMYNDMFNLNKMFQAEYKIITITLVIYLLVSMIASTHLVNIFEGPMRSKM